jgi:glycosyltransferase involved in cell wall biosynthesis
MNLLFVGHMSSPFMRQDYELLKEDYNVSLFDLSIHTSYNVEYIKYFIKVMRMYKIVKDTDVIWMWAALPHAIPFILLSKLFNKPLLLNVGGDEKSIFTNWVLRNATCCIVPSGSTGVDLLMKTRINAFKIIPNWVEESICNEPLPEKQYKIITACCSPESEIRKGIPIFKEIAKTCPYEMQVLTRLPRSEYVQILKESKVYCQLSESEAFGISLLEAMAYGCVPVVSDRGALPWVVGDSGIIVPYGDVEKTELAIMAALYMDGSLAREQAKTFNKERKKVLVKELMQTISLKGYIC